MCIAVRDATVQPLVAALPLFSIIVLSPFTAVEETLQEAATAPVLESPPPSPLEPPVATTLGTAPEASAPVDASPLQPAASAVPTELSTEVPAAETGAIFADVLDTPPAKSSSGSSTSGDSVPRQQPGETFERFHERFVDFWALEVGIVQWTLFGITEG